MSTRETLLAEIDAFCARHEMSATLFGVRSIGDRTLVHGLRSGREPRSITIDRVRDFMVAYEPLQRRRQGNGHAVAA